MAQSILLLLSAALWAQGFVLALQAASSAADPETAKGKRSLSDIIRSSNTKVHNLIDKDDLALSVGHKSKKCGSHKWNMMNGVVNVPFVFSSEYVPWQKKLIRSALEEFSTVTCIRFIDRVSETDYISIKNGSGCWSIIGKHGGVQTLSLSTLRCMKYGVMQHEVMHALSFHHEHTRLDRDKFVNIIWQHISQENKADFKRESEDNLDMPYNYYSIMHYGRYTFTNTRGEPSIIPKPDSEVSIGQRYGLSGPDVVMINRRYACNLCRTKLLGASGNFSSSSASPFQADDHCLWLLHVPFSKVFLQVTSFISSSTNCTASIVVYDGANKRSPILATISPNQPSPVLISTGLFMLVEYITDNSCLSSFNAKYNTAAFGATFTWDKGSVVSPTYPSFYPNDTKDTSIIIAPPGFKVRLNFTLFDLESSPECSNDFLVIRDGGDTSAPILGTYCGTRTNLSALSTGPMMLLQFSSNKEITGTGYKAGYTFVPTEQNKRRSNPVDSLRNHENVKHV